jgi:DNA polymerase I
LGRKVAKSYGPKDAKLAIVSRSPGAYDVDAGRPFAGPSGMLLDHLLSLYNVERSEVFTTNVVLCKTDKPDKKAIAACRPRLQKELSQAQTIIAAGSEAASLLTGKTLKASRGQRFRIPKPTGEYVQVVTTFNPAAALRDDSYYPGLVQDFKRACTPEPPAWQAPQVFVVQSMIHAAEWLNHLMMQPLLGIDIETSGLSYDSKLVSIGFAYSGHEAVVFPREFCYSEAGLEMLRQWFRDVRPQEGRSLGGMLDQTHIYHNGQFDTQILREHGIPAYVDEDTMHISNMCDERPGTHSLDYLVQNELEWPDYTPEVIKLGKSTGWRTVGKDGPPFTAWDEMYQYNGTDAVALMQLYPLLKDRMEQQSKTEEHVPTPKSYYNVVRIPAANAYADVERRGIPFDSEKARQLNKEIVLPALAQMNTQADKLVTARAGRNVHINLNSSQQCGGFIYKVLGAKDFKLNRDDRGQPKPGSVDAKHRERILEEHASDSEISSFVTTLDDFKRLDKTRSTYLEPLPKLVDADGRIRCSILLHGAETGRTSAQKPNLQNQPRTSDADIERGNGWVNIRQLYYAPPGYKIIQADYSQLELRTAAVLSQDPGLLQVFLDGRDLHSEVATDFFGPDYTKDQRVLAKAVNFGILFGIRAGHFSMINKVPVDESQRMIDAWWELFPGVREWVAEVRHQARQVGELTSPFGHRRRFHLITDQNLDHTMKEAVNFYVQGTAAQFTTLAVVELEPILSKLLPDPLRNGIVLTVHDSILALVPDEYVRETALTMKHTMESIAQRYLQWFQIPFKVDVEVGQDWGHLQEYA